MFGLAALLSIAAGLLLRITLRRPRSHRIHGPAPHVQGTADGLHRGRHPDLRWIFGLAFVQTYTRGALNVFTVVIAFELLDQGDSGVAALSAAVGVGGIVGSLAVSWLVGSRHLGLWFVVALACWGAPIALMGAAPLPPLIYLLTAVVGVANAVVDVPIFTLPVRLVRDVVLARAFGVFESVITAGMALGSIATRWPSTCWACGGRWRPPAPPAGAGPSMAAHGALDARLTVATRRSTCSRPRPCSASCRCPASSTSPPAPPPVPRRR